MTRRVDLTIGQRLALGFGAVAFLLGLLAVVAEVQAHRIAGLDERKRAEVWPRVEAAERLERAILYTGLTARSYVLAPGPERRQAYERSLHVLREELEALGRMPKDQDDQALYQRVSPLADQYEMAAASLVISGPLTGEEQMASLEAGMVSTREDLLEVVRGYSALQRRKLEELRAATSGAVLVMESSVFWMGSAAIALLAAVGWLTMRAVRRPAQELVEASRRLAAGDYGPALELAKGPDQPRRDELAELARSFGRMASELGARERRLRAGADLASALAATMDLERLCLETLERVLEYTGAEAGAVYLVDADSKLRRRFTVGLPADGEALQVGEGIPGRAAQSRRTVAVADLPADSPFSIRLGVDQLPPRAVAAAPMLLPGGQAAGVIAVASARPLPESAVEMLEHAAAQLSVNVQSALGHARVKEMAAELQEKNEILQAQVEEIHAQQEELQSQQEEIQAQNEELKSQNEELQAQGEELQAQGEDLRLMVDRLSAREESLREADRNKNDFLAVLSHELRNPLAPIKNGLHVLARAAPGGEQAQRARAIIERQVTQLARLVDDLLDVTRISRGKVQLRRAPVDLGKLLNQVAEDAGAELLARGLQLSVEIPREPVVADGDPARLGQVVGNLLQNAIKFTPRGGRVMLALTVSGGTACIRVRDTGAGMERETLERLFQPFVQADATLARTNGGLGLGLALVKGLVEMHGGKVRAASAGKDQGTEITVELPAGGGAAEPVRNGAMAAAAATRRVLVIEDNVDAADSLREALAISGHDVEVAYRGTEGIARAREWRPEVLLCDIGLPDIDGHQVAETFRSDPALQSIYRIALTGYALPEDRRRAAEAGFHEHLAKPPSLERLEELLAHVPVTVGSS